MIETLVNIDRNFFLLLNGQHSEFMDVVMWWAADRFFWIPLYVILAVFILKKFGKPGVFMILFAAILVLLSDQGSVLTKSFFERLRPCHDASLSFLVHTVRNKCGGQFGFVSSHAANSMGLLTYILLLTKNQTRWVTWLLSAWVILLGYSRVYMGVHFPADILGGWMIGIISAFITYFLYRLAFQSPMKPGYL